MGQYDSDAWYLFIFGNKEDEYVGSSAVYAWSKESATEKVKARLITEEELKILDVLYCGQYEPKSIATFK